MKDLKNSKSKKITILVVEDSPTQSVKLKYILEEAKYKVTLATNGIDALEKISKNKPDMIISDIMMPIMDGYELSKTVKNNPKTSDIPIILLTMLSESEDILKSLECGADMYISKPYDQNYLLHHIELILTKNPEIKGIEKGEEIEITYYTKKYRIKAEFIRVINLLFSTYEIAVSKNRELLDSQNELIKLNNSLEELVSQRTEALLDEIAERKIIEKELRKSEEKYRRLLNTLQEGIWVVDSNGNTTFVNDIMPSMLGYSKKEMIGKNLLSFVDESQAEFVKKQIEKNKQGIFQQVEFEFKKKDGTKIQTLLETGPVTDDKGNYIGAIAGVIDITERQRHEKQLKNLNIVLKAIRNVNQLIVRETDKGELIRKVCKILVETGSFRHAFITLIDEKREFLDFAVCGNITNTEKMVENLKNGNIPLCYIEALDNPNKIATKHPSIDCNSCEFMDTGLLNGTKSLTSVLNFNKKIYGFMTISVLEDFIEVEEGFKVIEEVVGDIAYALHTFDIKDKQKKGEEFIAWQEKYFEYLLENANVWLDAIDNEGNLIFWNRKAEEITGFNRDFLIGNQRKWELMYPENGKGKELLEYCKNLIKENKTIKNVDTEITTSSGEKRMISWSSNLIYDEQGKVKGSMFVGEDVTERNKAAEEIISAKERAEEMNRLKSSFLANMSHELRTPMNGILGFSEILKAEDQIDSIKEIAQVINKSGRRLMNTLNSILSIARIESGEMKSDENVLNVFELANHSVELFNAEAKKKNLELKLDSKYEVIYLRTDERMVSDIINNLISNAIKFTEQGGITVKVYTEKNDEQNDVIIEVIDTGIGIKEKHFNSIFDEFRQVSEGLSRSFEGTGLGLTICKRYVEMLGGSISVRSKLNEGTTFTVSIPLNIHNDNDMQISKKTEDIEPVTNQNVKISVSRPKILYVEDDDISIILIEKLLKHKYDLDFATKAAEALKKAKEKKYNLILMDINLGLGKSGIDATNMIRKLEYYKNIPIIAVTAFAMIGDKEEFINKACDDYISKPFDKNELIKMVDKYIKIK